MHQTVSGFTEVSTTETSLMTGARVNPHNRIVLKEIKKHVAAYLNQQPVHVRQLRPRHVHKISQHLLALPEKDRYLRFGYLPSDEQIERYVARLDFSQCTLFGVFDTDLVLQGVSQLSYIAVELSAHTAEFGVSTEARALVKHCSYVVLRTHVTKVFSTWLCIHSGKTHG